MAPLVITRFTLVSALGRGLTASARALHDGRSGLRRCTLSAGAIDTYVGEVDGLDDVALPPELSAFVCRNNRLACLGLQTDGFAEAVRVAAARHGPERVAVVLGTTTSGVAEGEKAFRERDPQDGSLPSTFRHAHTVDHHALTDFVRRYLGLRGPALTISTACSSSSKTFVDAWQLIHAGVCDAVVVGGVDSLCGLSLHGFASLDLLSREPCRPNDADRAGISIGEAAGFALVESASGAHAGPLALLGYGESADAYHLSAPQPEGKGAELAMRAALARAGLQPADVDYVNLHGTGTPSNDRAEDRAVSAVFGSSVACSSTKGWTGHTLGAAGITNAVLSLLCIGEGFVPQNLNLQRLDPDFRCRVLTTREDRPVRRVLTNAFGFGGTNCSLVFGTLR